MLLFVKNKWRFGQVWAVLRVAATVSVWRTFRALTGFDQPYAECRQSAGRCYQRRGYLRYQHSDSQKGKCGDHEKADVACSVLHGERHRVVTHFSPVNQNAQASEPVSKHKANTP